MYRRRDKGFISIGTVNVILILVAATPLNDNTEFARLPGGGRIYMAPAFSITVFYFSAQHTVPEMACGFSHAPERLPKAVITGMLTTFVLLSIMLSPVIALTGLKNQLEVAILAWGKAFGGWALFVANTFVLCVMLTPYWGLSGSSLASIFDKLHKLDPENRPETRLLALMVVALSSLVLAYSGLVGFINALYFAGAFSGVILPIMPILILRSACRNGDLEPAWRCS